MTGAAGYTLAGVLGALIGSFLNVCIYRLPKKISVVSPSSHCIHCGNKLRPWELVPILSYIFLLGRCSRCKHPISIRYPLVEIIATLLSIACWIHFAGIKYYLVYFLLFVAPLIVVIFIDLEHRIIPDLISIPGILAGVLIRTMFAIEGERVTNLIDSMAGAIVGGGFLLLIAAIYERIKKQEGLGGGDVKLMAMLGAFFGWQAAIFILFLSSFVGALTGLVIMVIKRQRLTMAIPFGPFLAAAGIFWLFYGLRLLNLYLMWILKPFA